MYPIISSHSGSLVKINPCLDSFCCNCLYVPGIPNRFTTSFLIAFDGLPKLIKPNKEAQLFELRTYEGYSEDAVRRKVKMFNKEEFSIFDATGLNSVFFGEQISGPLMPALTYMLVFNSMEERNSNWEKFSKHPKWKRVSALKEYANTVSDIKRTFLRPFKYSQL